MKMKVESEKVGLMLNIQKTKIMASGHYFMGNRWGNSGNSVRLYFLGLQSHCRWWLPREQTGHSKHPLLTTQVKTLHMDITKWSILKSDWLYSLQPKMEKLYTVSKNKTRGWLWLRSWAKFRLKLRKVGKTSRPFRYDLIQIPYDYTVEVRNRFKGLDLIHRVPDELWTEVCDIVTEIGIKTIPIKRNAKKQNGCLRRPYK